MLVQLLAAAVGVFMMFAPPLFSLGSGVSDLLWLLGPLAIAFGIMAGSAVLRGLRRASVLVGLAALVGPWLVSADPAGIIVSGLSGLALIATGLAPSEISEDLGGGWRGLLRG